MKQLILYSDAKAKTERFAICDHAGNPVWYGRFFDNDYDFNGEQSSGELSAAKKAVFLASKVQEEINEPLKLTLYVDAQWLCWANADNGKGGKAKKLRSAAKRLGVEMEVVHISGKSNPADQYTICKGFKKWQDNVLSELISEC